MKKTLVELFAGVGGFRCGLNHVELKDGYSLTEEEVKLYVKKHLPDHERPDHVVFHALPRTVSGKVIREKALVPDKELVLTKKPKTHSF